MRIKSHNIIIYPKIPANDDNRGGKGFMEEFYRLNVLLMGERWATNQRFAENFFK